MLSTLVAMVPAIIKLYLLGTIFSIVAVLYSVVDSFGALVQDHSYMDMYLEEQKAEKKIRPAPIQEAPQGPNTRTPDGNSGLSADELL